ncbi:MAG: response regulator transcription factor [Pseudoflavonifractor sp.]|nr:response regulator transcription factor [Pseudoflavonifractor sp.]
MIQAYIITHNTLESLGLKYLLSRYFDIEATVLPEVPDVTAGEAGSAAMFFTDTETFAVRQEFFIPRRPRTVIITPGTNGQSLSQVIASGDSASRIVERLQDLLADCPQDSPAPSPLSQREIDVLSLVAKGHINKEIADELSISLNTVLSHRKNITSKLGIRSVSGLAFYAIMHGYVSGSDLRH